MKSLRGGVLAAVTAVAAPASATPPADGAAAGTHALDAETIVLANGLRVFLAPDPDARWVSVRVSYNAGAADDPAHLHGLAHLTEHMVAGRTRHIPAVLHTLVAAGATEFNAITSPDRTSYFESVAPERLETALWVESDRMAFASSEVTDARVAAEHPVIDNEMRMRTRDSGLTAANQAQTHEIFPSNHRYTKMNDEPDTQTVFSARDVQAFLATWYWPANATLSIAGKFDRDSALSLVRRYFEDLPSAPGAARPTLSDALPAPVTLEIFANVPIASAWLAWRTPAFGAPGDAALDLAAAILVTERLQTELVGAQLATTVFAHQQSLRDGSLFLVRATCALGVPPDRLARAMQASVARLATQVETGELARAQQRTRISELERLSSTEGRTRALESLGRLGDIHGSMLDQALSRQRGLTEQDVAGAVRQWLTPAHQVSTLVFTDRSMPLAGRLTRRYSAAP